MWKPLKIYELNNAVLEAGKGKKMNFPLEPQEGVWSSGHLGFYPVKPILAF
jgi:hypothetical protein